MAARLGSAGARDQLIGFERTVETRRAGGGRDTTVSQIGEAWVAVEWVRGGESERQGALRELQVYRFRALSEAIAALGLTLKDVIVWNGQKYNLREMPRRLAGSPETEIIAEFVAPGEA